MKWNCIFIEMMRNYSYYVMKSNNKWYEMKRWLWQSEMKSEWVRFPPRVYSSARRSSGSYANGGGHFYLSTTTTIIVISTGRVICLIGKNEAHPPGVISWPFSLSWPFRCSVLWPHLLIPVISRLRWVHLHPWPDLWLGESSSSLSPRFPFLVFFTVLSVCVSYFLVFVLFCLFSCSPPLSRAV